MNDSANAFRAGLVIVLGVVIAAGFYLASVKFFLSQKNATSHFVYLQDATGVNKKSYVTVAGVQVGEIKDLVLLDVPIGEFDPDFKQRALKALGFNSPANAKLMENPDFDEVVNQLVSNGKIPSHDEVTKSKLTEADVTPAIDEAAKVPWRVARVDFFVNAKEALPVDTIMQKDSLGLLGAKALMLHKGTSPELLKDGDRIVNARSMSGTDALLAQAQGIVSDVRGITNKLDRDIGGITSDIKGITGELNRFVNGDGKTMPLDELYKLVMSDLRRLSNSVSEAVTSANHLIKDNDQQFTELVKNINHISADIADLTAKGTPGAGADGGPANEGDIRATMASVRKVADDLSVVTGQLKDILGDNNDDTKEEVRSLKQTIKELNSTLASLSEVAGRVERGEGTVGRLLTDEKIADKVESAVSGAADYVSSLTSIEAHIDVGTYYNFNRGAETTTASLMLVPKPDKFYLIEVTDDGGRLERFTETDQNGNFLRESIRQEDNQLRISAEFAKRFFDFLVLRIGLIENTGGAGMNLYFLDNRVELRSDLFDFRGPRDTLATDKLPSFYLPRWRTMIKAQPIQFVYLSAGVDDVLNAWTPAGGLHLYNKADDYGLDWFVGAGLTFKDDDLRSILPFIPK